jgi:RNA polymerase sigma-B factor
MAATKTDSRRQLRRRADPSCKTHERRLVVRYQRQGDLSAREELIERFLPLARSLARRFRYTDEPQADLEQVAAVGLIKAVDRYDPDHGVAISSYAVPTILGELKRYFRDSAWTVRIPRTLQERIREVDDAAAKLAARLGRSPTVREVADTSGLTSEQVLEAKEASAAYSALSLDAPRAGGDEADDDGQSYADRLGRDDARFELVELGHSIAPSLRRLPHQERVALELRFGRDMTQHQIAERIGVSQMQVSRLLRRALGRLRGGATSEAPGASGAETV